jgi:hypothetical protein
MNSWFHSGGKIKIQVHTWLLDLRQHIEDENIKVLVELARNMLHEHPDSRPSAYAVQIELTVASLRSLANRLAKQYELFLEGSGNFNLEMEKKRFDEWRIGMGIKSTMLLKNNSRIGILSQFSSELRQHILAMCELIQIGHDSIDDLEEIYLSTREHNDFLWKILPLETRKDIQVQYQYTSSISIYKFNIIVGGWQQIGSTNLKQSNKTPTTN